VPISFNVKKISIDKVKNNDTKRLMQPSIFPTPTGLNLPAHPSQPPGQFLRSRSDMRKIELLMSLSYLRNLQAKLSQALCWVMFHMEAGETG
jgi:hypothetical protein